MRFETQHFPAYLKSSGRRTFGPRVPFENIYLGLHKIEHDKLCGKLLPNPPEGGHARGRTGEGGKWISLLSHTGGSALWLQEIELY